MQQFTRYTDYAGQNFGSYWVRFPLMWYTHVPVRLKGTDQTLFTFTSGLGYQMSIPIGIEEINRNLATGYVNHGFSTDMGFQLEGPFGSRMKLAYRLSMDLFSSKASVANAERLKFIDNGFVLGMSASFAGGKERRNAFKAERKAKKEAKKAQKGKTK
jgi:hypothetical protein